MRRLALALFFVLGMASLGWADITVVTSAIKQSTNSNGTTTAALDTTGATLLVFGIAHLDAQGPGTPSDSKANTWAQAATAGNTCGIDIFYVKNPAVGSGHTFSNTGTANYPSLFILAFAGTDTSADRDQQNSATASTATTIQPGSVTPSTNNQVVVTVVCETAVSGTWSIDGGFTISNQGPVQAGAAYGGGMAYLIQTTAAAANPTWTTNSAAAFLSAGVDTFKTAASAGDVTTRRRLIQ